MARDAVKSPEQKDYLQSILGKFLGAVDDVRKIGKDKRLDPDVQRYLIETKIWAELEDYNDPLIRMLKEVMLVRQRDRSIREQAIRASKILLKINPNLGGTFKRYKFHVFISFILEREFKNNMVAKERQ